MKSKTRYCTRLKPAIHGNRLFFFGWAPAFKTKTVKEKQERERDKRTTTKKPTIASEIHHGPSAPPPPPPRTAPPSTEAKLRLPRLKKESRVLTDQLTTTSQPPLPPPAVLHNFLLHTTTLHLLALGKQLATRPPYNTKKNERSTTMLTPRIILRLPHLSPRRPRRRR